MKQFFTSFFLLFFMQFNFAQYTEVINSKRPGFSDSPYSVGTKIYQVEAGFFYKNVGNYLYYDAIADESVAYSAKAFGTDITFRTGQFFEKLEFNLDLVVQNENRDYTKPTIYSESGLGLSKLTIGAKYLAYKPAYTDKSKEIRSWKARHSFDKRRLIPAIGVYAGLNTNFLNDLYKNPGGLSPKLAIFTQNDLSNRWVVLTNFIMDQAFTDASENSFILTSTYALTQQWSVFGEGQSFFRKNVPNDFQFGVGAAYLVSNDIQADFSARMIYDERGDNSFLFGGGISWRLDRHKDRIIRHKVDNDDTKLEKENKSFFNKITFGLFGGNKKSSNSKKMRNVKTSKAKTRSLEPPVNKKAQKAKKKNNKRLIKQQKEREKAQKKHNKKLEKS
ncbi:MAG: transporter [Flavobacteriaceae bacterium]|nr:transporter [Flavobacteriaceae bacterium]